MNIPSAASSSITELFRGEVPANFAFNGQTWEERVEGWLMHAIEQLENEITVFKESGDPDEEGEIE